MPRTGLTHEEMKETALDAAERLIRRHGLEKTRLVDIAKEIGVSHPVLYRIFPDRSALMDSVSERWLCRVDVALGKIARSNKSARDRLHDWFRRLHRLKRAKVSRDPELYHAFNSSSEMHRPVVVRHLANTREQLLFIVRTGMESGELQPGDPDYVARMFFTATLSFHHPKLVFDNLSKKNQEKELSNLLNALLDGVSEHPGS